MSTIFCALYLANTPGGEPARSKDIIAYGEPCYDTLVCERIIISGKMNHMLY